MRKKAKGAVSIFLVIVLFSTTLLGGLFIDASRILLAKRYVRNALDASARSALSYYDQHLASEYGLFAVDQETAQAALARYFKTNLKLSQNEGFDILRMDVRDEDIQVTLSDPIVTQGNLVAGMEEYSKYRVVVNTSLGVIEKLKNIFGSGGAADKTFNAANTGKEAMDQLKDDVTAFSNQARNLLHSAIKTNTDRVKNSVSNILADGSTTKLSDADLGFDEIEKNLQDAQAESNKITSSREQFDKVNQEQTQNMENLPETTSQYWDEDSGSWKTETGSAVLSGEDDGQGAGLPSISQEAQKEKESVDAQIQATRTRFEEKKTQIRAKSQAAAECNRKIQTLTATVDAAKAQVKLLQTQLDELKANRLKDRFNFILGEDSDETLVELTQAYELLEKELDALKSSKAAQSQIDTKQAEVDTAAKALDDYVSGMTKPPKTAYDDQIKAKEDALKEAKAAQAAAEAALKKEKETRDKLVKEIQKLYDEIAAPETKAGELKIPESLSGEDKKNANEDAASFATEMLTVFGKMKGELGKTASDVNGTSFQDFSFGLDGMTEDIWGTIEELLEMGDGLVTLVTDPEEAGTAMLFTDYVFDNFTFLTTQTMRDNRHFQMAEVEYILQGNDSQAKCIVSTVSDIAMLRLLINWVDYMATTHSPEIISRMVIALGRALVRTTEDMASMIFTLDSEESATCALCPSFSKVRLTYSDHLRLAMLLRAIGDSGRSTMTSRILTMMKDTYAVQNWGSLDTRYTRIQATAQVEVDLVMLTLPMFEAVLPPDNQILQDGKFLVRESVDIGY